MAPEEHKWSSAGHSFNFNYRPNLPMFSGCKCRYKLSSFDPSKIDKKIETAVTTGPDMCKTTQDDLRNALAKLHKQHEQYKILNDIGVIKLDMYKSNEFYSWNTTLCFTNMDPTYYTQFAYVDYYPKTSYTAS